MTVIIFLVLISIFHYLYNIATCQLADVYRRNHYPESMKELFEPGAFDIFISFKTEKKKLVIIQFSVTVLVYLVTILSGIFTVIEQIIQNPYGVTLASGLLLLGEDMLISGIAGYVYIFHLKKRYEDVIVKKKDFWINHFWENILAVLVTLFFSCIMCFIGEHLNNWISYLELNLLGAMIICTAIVGMIVIFFIGCSYLSTYAVKKQYTFTPIENDVLRKRILDLQCKDEINQIYIYDESRVTNVKNAFVINGRIKKEIAISDTFMENATDEDILAICAHEIGHLNRKKTVFDYMRYMIPVIAILLGVIAIQNMEWFTKGNELIRNSFHINKNNYYLIYLVITEFISPFVFLIEIISKYLSRKEEYEADQNVVKCGLGIQFIKILKELAKDSTEDACTHTINEFLEEDHPSIYKRICAMEKQMNLMNE